jgi:hypothetical protein
MAANHESSVGGESFGLTFVLLLASRLVGAPIPGDLVCSAAIDPEGRVAQVAGLKPKISAILKFAHGVRKLVVAASQADEADKILSALGVVSSRLTVVAVKNVGHALDSVFGNGYLDEVLERAGANSETRREVIRSFLHLALQGRGEFVYWTPFEQAARQARKWTSLDANQRYILEFAEGVAARHERNQGDLSLPSPGFLDRWPRRLRDQILPHLVQQSADTGRPDPRDVRELSEPFRVHPLREGYLPQLKLEGALARLDAVTGRPRAALETQFELARVYLDSFAPEEVSFPLCECYRLAGVLADAAAFERAEGLLQETEAAGGVGLQGSAYVDLARCKARLLLQQGDEPEIRRVLTGVAMSRAVAAHVRWSAARWLHRCVSATARDELDSVTEALSAACNEPDAKKCHAAQVQEALIRLDRFLVVSDEAGADQVVAHLEGREHGLIGLLRTWAPEGHVASHVARFYPY